MVIRAPLIIAAAATTIEGLFRNKLYFIKNLFFILILFFYIFKLF
jgi:hypothetical protein